MPRARVQDGIDLEYEVFGEDGEPVVLVMGVGAQMVLWDDELCARFARRGYHVLRFDHRDIGRSTWLDHLGLPPVRRNFVRALLHRPIVAPYTLSDMARDVVGLLDAVGWPRAHVIGASMGGMIAQHLAIEHPGRLLSLTSIMSGPGGVRNLVGIRPRALAALFGPTPRSREEAMDLHVALFRALGGRLPLDEARLRARAAVAFDRGHHPAGFARHWSAILASGNRLEALRAVDMPALVIHGDDDPLLPLAGGRATARAIRGARLEVVEGMGHDLPEQVWDRLLDRIDALTARRG